MLDQIGFSFKEENGCLKVVKGSIVIMKGVKMNGLYILDGRTVIGSVSNVQKQCISKTRVWHKRLGHIQELGKKNLLGGDKLEPLGFCKQCAHGKTKRIKFENGIHQTKQIMDYIHLDLWGPSRTITHANGRYFFIYY